MMKTGAVCLIAVVLCAGCASPSARQVAAFPDYHASQDYRIMENVFESMDSIANGVLRIGMSPVEVRHRMGRPELDQSAGRSRVQIWTYLVSISGTWTYSVVFLDGQLEHFGRLNPQWLGDPMYDDCKDPGIKRIQRVRKEEKAAEPSVAVYGASRRN